MWKLVWRFVADHPLECLNVGFDLPRQPIREYEPGNSPDTQHPDRHDDFGDLGAVRKLTATTPSNGTEAASAR